MAPKPCVVTAMTEAVKAKALSETEAVKAKALSETVCRKAPATAVAPTTPAATTAPGALENQKSGIWLRPASAAQPESESSRSRTEIPETGSRKLALGQASATCSTLRKRDSATMAVHGAASPTSSQSLDAESKTDAATGERTKTFREGTPGSETESSTDSKSEDGSVFAAMLNNMGMGFLSEFFAPANPDPVEELETIGYGTSEVGTPKRKSNAATLSQIQKRQLTAGRAEPPTPALDAIPETMSKTWNSSTLTVSARAMRLSVADIVSSATQHVMHPNISYGWWTIALILLVFAIMVETDNAGDFSHIEAYENLIGFGNHYWWKWHHLSMF